MTTKPLRIGYVPEHFSTPLYYAQKYFGLTAELISFPSGTGHMITSLRSQEIDVAIGLTEGWVAGLGKDAVTAENDGGYQIVGTYVDTPLCWAISTGPQRKDITSITALQNGKIGISRVGSGSYVMGYVLADQNGWLTPPTPPFIFTPLQTFANLRSGVQDSSIDFFMWEHFTSKRYYDNGEIKRVGEIYTPWSSWKIVASTNTVLGKKGEEGDRREELEGLFKALDEGVRYFEENVEESVKYIGGELDYSEEDAREWLKTVKFTKGVKGVDSKVIEKTVGILKKAGVLPGDGGMVAEEMIAFDKK